MNPEILDHGEVLYIEILERGQSLRLATLAGKCAAIHSSRSAKAIAAFLRENRLQELLALARMVRVTDRTSISFH